MIELSDIRRLYLGHYTVPADSKTLPGEKLVMCAYVIRTPGGLLLFDTGLATGHEEIEQAHAPITRKPFRETLAGAGVDLGDVATIVNCHLHIDHCGNNPLFPQVPIFVQKQELDELHTNPAFMPRLMEFDGVQLEVHDGEADVAPGLRIIHTPGHTPGHQSLLVETTAGRVLLAGQAVDFASEYARAIFTLSLDEAEIRQGLPEVRRPWIDHLRELDVRRVYFAHDLLIWDRDLA